MTDHSLRRTLARIFSLLQKQINTPGQSMRRREVARAKAKNETFVKCVHEIKSRMHIDPQNYFANVYIGGSYEPTLVRFLKKTVGKDWTCIDIGANIGYFSLLMGRLVGPTGQIYAVEPTPSTYKMLVENIQLNSLSNTRHEQLALSDHNGSLQFHIGPPGYEVYNSAGEITHPAAMDQVFKAITVPCETLDNYCSRQKIKRVHLIKIDVEGDELSVLRGMDDTMKTNPEMILVVEFADQTTAGFGYQAREIGAWLKDKGYNLFLLKSFGRTELIRSADQSWRGEMIVVKK
jgi:FkbM family methyltransferase